MYDTKNYPSIILTGQAAEDFMRLHCCTLGDEFSAKAVVRVAGLSDYNGKTVTLEFKKLSGLGGKKNPALKQEYDRLQEEAMFEDTPIMPAEQQGILGESGETQLGEGGEIEIGE